MMNIYEEIGEAACLEQLAEECCELAQAALKLARIERGENPTPKLKYSAMNDLMEEAADVYLCMDVLNNGGVFWEDKELDLQIQFKLNRWIKRLKEGC